MFKDIDIKFVDKEDTYAAYGQSTCCALPVVFVVFVVVKKRLPVSIFYARHNIIKSVALS